MKKVLSVVCVLGLSALPITTISAKETNQHNLGQIIGNRFTEMIDKLKVVRSEKLELEKERSITLKEFEKHLFPGLKDDELVVQVNEGGFLYSNITDAETTKKEFEESNEGVKCKIMTVAQAKEIYKKEFLASYDTSSDK